MKHYTVVVYDLRLCMQEDSTGFKNIKRDNCFCKTGGYLTHSSSSNSLWRSLPYIYL